MASKRQVGSASYSSLRGKQYSAQAMQLTVLAKESSNKVQCVPSAALMVMLRRWGSPEMYWVRCRSAVVVVSRSTPTLLVLVSELHEVGLGQVATASGEMHR